MHDGLAKRHLKYLQLQFKYHLDSSVKTSSRVYELSSDFFEQIHNTDYVFYYKYIY